ncbi:glycosyltransferase [Salipiger sp. PrR003]|uniref:glycosyltransferase n=1 Tax=Salipiger sp. PrR003 TaxID=2706776 RepID=UPI0013DC7ED6|nr:glycosyltransferase [Salipiger sp. PrR003]NDV51656.1 glycosyltransferase [Salipiger sp. PrR003]
MKIGTAVSQLQEKLVRRKTGSFYGNIDLFNETVLAGWLKRRTDDRPQSVDIYLNGTLIASGIPADLERPDVREAGFGNGFYGFHIALNDLTPPLHGSVKVSVHPAGVNTPLFSQIKTFTAGTVSVQPNAAQGNQPVFPAANAPALKPVYEFAFEKLSQRHLQGWAVDTGETDRIFDVRVLIDGVPYCTLRNNIHRNDLLRAGVSKGIGGFATSFNLEHLEPGDHTVTVQLPNGTSVTETIQCGRSQNNNKEIITVTGKDCPQTVNAWLSSAPYPLAVVVPVYNAAEDLEICIERLAAYTPEWVDILFVNDASPEPAIMEILSGTEAHANMRVLHNDENMGFTRTVNRGLNETGRADVIILNSDARVTPRWVAGLRAAVVSRPRVATVTAMSDRAGAFSAPTIGNDNELPAGVDEVTYARAFRRRSLGLYPAVPTGNGFCMYITRACMDDIGLLDAQAFPRGYGEENDFCMRAGRAGWHNLIDDRTYVFHDRSKSFGDTKTDLMRQGREVVDARYPEYKKLTAVYKEHPDILMARHRAALALRDCTMPEMSQTRVLFVVSTKTGGTPQTNRDLMNALDDALDGWLLRCDSHILELSRLVEGRMVTLRQHRLTEPVDPISHGSTEYDAVVTSWLTTLDPDILHMRHLGWHGLSLPRIARELDIRTVFSFHDFYALCPTVKLIDAEQRFCGGTCTAGQGDCKAELWPENSLPRLRDGWVHTWRQRFSEALSQCDAFITTSESARARILSHLPGVSAERFSVIPHGRDFPDFGTVRSTPDGDQKIRILMPGNIDEAKGLRVIQDLVRQDRSKHLEFHILGKIYAQNYEPHPQIILHGSYTREEFKEKAAQIKPHLGGIFSIWDETYCHTLTELWSIGLPALVFDYPTVATRVRNSGAGWVLDHSDIPALYERILELALDDKEMQERVAAVNAWQRGYGRGNTTRLMGAKYLNVYRKVMTPGARDITRIGVVCPQNADLRNANASTQIRIWARTHNSVDRDVCYIRLSPASLLALVRRGDLDGAILQRTAIPRPMIDPLRAAFAESNIPFVLDLDDDLLDVPQDKDPEQTYADYAPFLRRLIRDAAMITVSTQPLLEKMRDINRNVALLPNLLSDRLWRSTPPAPSLGDTVRALYMGSPTHGDDLKLLMPALEEIHARHPEFRLTLIGISTSFDTSLPDYVETLEIPNGMKSYRNFVPWLREQSARFHFAVAPLRDTSFNASKSSLKGLEYAGLGLPTLASETDVYRPLAQNAPHIETVANETEAWVEALSARITAGAANRVDGAELRAWVEKHGLMGDSLHAYDELIRRMTASSDNRKERRTPTEPTEGHLRHSDGPYVGNHFHTAPRMG